MDWFKLLNYKRFGESSEINYQKDFRSVFQRDFDRILFSSAFRRMHDKTQVFPVPENDFVHNRLTHSLEVSSVARSLGNLAGKFIIEEDKEKYQSLDMSMFGDVCAAAALAHDVGNPPFGHSGEKAIADYFIMNEESLKKDLTEAQWNDLIRYEGNAHGFRLLTHHHPDEMKGGLRLSYATLAAFTKYPRSSSRLFGPNKPKRTSAKKFGYFQSELSYYQEVAEACDLPLLKDVDGQKAYARHPLSFLVEAADNICYRIIDLEDGYKLRYLSFKEIEELLLPLIENASDTERALATYAQIIDKGERVGYLRAKAISILVMETIEVFKSNYKQILSTEFDSELTDYIASVNILEGDIKKANLALYKQKVVVEIELAGYEVIGTLLDKYVKAAIHPQTNYNQNLLSLIPDQFKIKDIDTSYEKYLKMTDFVARMTDHYALNLHRKLSGAQLPIIK